MAGKRWEGCPLEEAYFGDDRKVGKAQRKRAQDKDRSQYKKTDRAKSDKKTLLQSSLMEANDRLLRGRVLSITPQGIVVDYDGRKIICALKGLLKKDKSQFKNLVTVGDFVRFEESGGNEGTIVHVEPRVSVLSRADNLSRRKAQLIAANIDQVMIVVSVISPPLKPFLVDRYIIAARKGGMAPIIIVNKIDLLQDLSLEPEQLEQENALHQAFLQAYEQAGVPVISISAVTGDGMDDLRAAMQGKASVFSGQSGVGKSSLINVMTGLDLRIGEVVERTQKGSHTTTTTNLIQLPFGGWCIDTPGIKSFGVWDLKFDEVESYFSEIHACGRECKYPRCSHTDEPDCAVRIAIEEGKISVLRYQSYQYLIHSVKQEHLRR